MEMHGDWIRTDQRLPERGVPVLVWYPRGDSGFGISRLVGEGTWASPAGEGDVPAYWMSLPEPPGGPAPAGRTAYEGSDGASRSPADEGLCGEIIDGRLMLDIDEEPEAVARMMQHFIDGSAAVISGSAYFVTDISNEMIQGQMISVFYITPAE